jgi:hypothetical protein
MSTTRSPKIDQALSPGLAKTRGHFGLWHLLITEMPFPRSKALGERVDVGDASAQPDACVEIRRAG